MQKAYLWIKDGTWVYGQIVAEITGLGFIKGEMYYQITYHLKKTEDRTFVPVKDPGNGREYEIMDELTLKSKIRSGELLDSMSDEVMHRYWAMT